MNRKTFVAAIIWIVLFGVLSGCVNGQQKAAAAPAQSTEPTAAQTVFHTEAPTPTPVPTPTPLPMPTPVPTPERITDEMLDSGMFDSYFDDAVFVGDSLTWIFSHYVRNVRNDGSPDYLGKAQFLGVVNMNIWRASHNDVRKDAVNFVCRGQEVSLTDGLQAFGAKKAFIMLGLNDLHLRRWTDVEANFETVIETLQTLCPDTEIIIEGVLPVRRTYYGKSDPAWNDFNPILGEICKKHGVTFLCFAKEFTDENGELKAEYCGDGNCHLTTAGEELWVRCLRKFAARQMRGSVLFDTPFSADRWLNLQSPKPERTEQTAD